MTRLNEQEIALNPWHPTQDPIDLAVLGKLGEELAEAGSAVARCIIQGVNECEPVTGKENLRWLAEEIADVKATIAMAEARFGLNPQAITNRMERKIAHLTAWHGLIAGTN